MYAYSYVHTTRIHSRTLIHNAHLVVKFVCNFFLTLATLRQCVNEWIPANGRDVCNKNGLERLVHAGIISAISVDMLVWIWESGKCAIERAKISFTCLNWAKFDVCTCVRSEWFLRCKHHSNVSWNIMHKCCLTFIFINKN